MSTSTTRPPTPAGRFGRRVRPRRIEFAYPAHTLPRLYVGGDLVMSHVVSTLSSLFPEGEDFFVHSVRNYRDAITDPELRSQVGGFIGQEAIHGREHRTFNHRLQGLGYPTSVLDRRIGRVLRLGRRVLPKPVQLAITAALEHYTATLAEVLLSDADAQAMLDVEEVRLLLLWHAVEESEHKTVAFDVFESVSGNHHIRAQTMNVVTVLFLSILAVYTAYSMLINGDLRHPRQVLTSLGALRHSPFLRPAVLRRIRDYNRRGFHPDDHDATELLERWRAELFGPEGALAGQLAAAG